VLVDTFCSLGAWCGGVVSDAIELPISSDQGTSGMPIPDELPCAPPPMLPDQLRVVPYQAVLMLAYFLRLDALYSPGGMIDRPVREHRQRSQNLVHLLKIGRDYNSFGEPNSGCACLYSYKSCCAHCACFLAFFV